MDSTQETRLPIAISMGCPAGIGPEIILKYCWQDCAAEQGLVIVGDIGVLLETAHHLDIGANIQPWEPGRRLLPNCLNVLSASKMPANSVKPGQPDRETGSAMAAYVETAVGLCLQDICGAMVTGPIAKTTLNLAGFDYPGHTEMIAARTNAGNVAMLMAGPRLRVVLATIHCALSEVPQMLSVTRLVELIQLVHDSLRSDFGFATPRIGVAGLNPHAGEDGMFGQEEQTIIGPAVTMAAATGIAVTGPYPPDTVFYKAAQGGFDVVLCMYHDQGLIPFKLLHFSDGVNVTLGLPIVRTSVDHGTGYDIAGKNRADCSSLAAAVDMAGLIVSNRTHQSA